MTGRRRPSVRPRSWWRARSSALAVVVVLVVVATTGCRPVPTPNTVDVIGDSITTQSVWNRNAAFLQAGIGAPSGSSVVIDAWLGNHFEDVEARERARVNDAKAPRPEVLVIALGLNNAEVVYGGDGWNAADEASFRRLLGLAHPDACVVVSLPAAGPKASAAWRKEITKMRAFEKAEAKKRANTVVIDWATVIAAHPEHLKPDGVHLADDKLPPGSTLLANPQAGDAFAAHLWSGVARCP